MSFARLVILAALIGLGTAGAATAQNCQELQGSWTNVQIEHPRNEIRSVSGEPTLFLEIDASCMASGTFDNADFTHRISARLSPSSGSQTASGAMTIVRTERRTGCTNKLTGRLYETRRGAIIGYIREMGWEITSSEPKCGMGNDHYERRSFERP